MPEMTEYCGKEVTVDGIPGCYVVHVDREVGITIHDGDDKPILCLNNAQLFAGTKHIKGLRGLLRAYHEAFSHIVRQIDLGIMDTNTSIRCKADSYDCHVYYGTPSVWANPSTCPYSSKQEEAVKQAESMRQKKIASLKRQIERLEQIRFE